MRHLLYIFLLSSIVLLVSCSSGKSKATPEQMNRLSQFVDDKHFEISSDMAYPQATSSMNDLQNLGLLPPGSNANQINLIGNVNYLRITGDSIYAELPYFGERRMNAAYNGSDSSIIIENVLQNYAVEKNDDGYTISFSAKSQTELLRFYIKVYPSLKTSILANGPTRVPIRYSGKAIPL